MASEAEIERLYQLFVANGGGAFTFSGTNLTPKQYTDAVSSSNLTPLEMAELEARQHQYNRQSALNTIADEIDANNFSNPYIHRASVGNNLLSILSASNGYTNVNNLNNAFSGFSSSDKALIFAGVLANTGIDIEGLLKVIGLSAIGVGMYNSLTNHTNNQTANIPQTMQDADALASMNAQFGEKGDPCDAFNVLMGILAGIYDGTLNFIEKAIGDITTFLNDSGITSLIQSIIAAIAGAGSVVADVITAISNLGLTLLGGVIGLVAKVINAMADITDAIASEIAALADMALQLIRKALALVLGGAAGDPCKKAVLMNTGSDEMKEAVTKINQPIGVHAPATIPVEEDSRASKEEVETIIKTVLEEAEKAGGVVQNPISEAAKEYTVNDTTINSSSAPTESIRPKMKPTDLVSAGEGESTFNGVESDDTSENFDEDSMPERKEGESMSDFMLRIGATRQATEEEKNSEQMKEIEITSIHYQHFVQEWNPIQLEYITKSNALISEMKNALKAENFGEGNLNFAKKAFKKRIKVLIEAQNKNQNTVKDLRDKYAPGFIYWAPSKKRNKTTEARINHQYIAVWKGAMTNTYNQAFDSLVDIQKEWNSIKSQLYQ